MHVRSEQIKALPVRGGEGGIRTLEGGEPYAFSRRAHSARLCDLSKTIERRQVRRDLDETDTWKIKPLGCLITGFGA